MTYIDWLKENLFKIDNRITSVKAETVSRAKRMAQFDPLDPGPIALGLPWAVLAAARVAFNSADRVQRKPPRIVDQQADHIIRRTLSGSSLEWEISSVEGAGDNILTLAPGKHIRRRKGGGARMMIAYDPVDGTSVLSQGGPGVVSVIGIGPRLREVTDTRSPNSFGLLVPYRIPDMRINLAGPLESGVLRALRRIGRARGKALRQLCVATWPDSRKKVLYEKLRGARIRIVFLRAAAEVNAILADDLRGKDSPIDVIMTGEGLIEAQIAAMLTDQRGGQGWIHADGHTDRLSEWVGRNQQNYVVIGAITRNPWLHLTRSRRNGTNARAQLLVSDPAGTVVRLTLIQH